jgi:hypothetical protein
LKSRGETLKRLPTLLSFAVAGAALFLGGAAFCQDPDELLGFTPVRLQASNPVHNNQFIDFGAAVGLDGDVLVIGAPGEQDSINPVINDTGAVYVFERQGLNWVETQKLRSPAETVNEKFGSSVAVAVGNAGIDFLIVGAPGYSSNIGRAYVFRRTNGGSWTYETFLTPEVEDGGEAFGASVAIDFSRPRNSPPNDLRFFAAVGARFDRDPNDLGNSQHGSISIFQRTGGPLTWAASHHFYGEPNEQAGSSVAIAGIDVIAGAAGLVNPGGAAGGGRAFQQANEVPAGQINYAPSWLLLPLAPGMANGQLGAAAALDYDSFNGGTAVLGDPQHDSPVLNAGRVYVFDLTPGGASTVRSEVAEIQPPGLPAAAAFGTSIALSGPLLAVGAPGNIGQGKVYLYERGATTATWNLAGELMPPAPPPFCRLTSVALQGLTAALGCSMGSPDYQAEGTYLYFASGIFFDGFESGGTGNWSATVP